MDFSKMKLTDLIDVETLERIQNVFTDMTGMAAVTTDNNGKPVTSPGNFTDFCIHYMRESDIHCKRCEECDRLGATRIGATGKPTYYDCHAGLTDFAAPIMADGVQVGCFIGGQVLTKEPDMELYRRLAKELDMDFDELWQVVQQVHIVSKDTLDKAVNFLYTTANIISEIAVNSYRSLEASQEMERAAKMKSDFLANMSHEIRTPMNAVIGMAEMALREDLPVAARDYVVQIKNSGNSLLNIINDILDFSKIDSGKMEIQESKYEILSLLNDIANIIVMRLKDRNVELQLEVDPNVPKLLIGDSMRVRQILINLANNAVKFTTRGRVNIRVKSEKIDEDTTSLMVQVADTGIGIKQEDIGKLFQSFQQLDSKRNRNVEGTGLGLAISKRLLDLMHGEIHVESEYEKGSIFSFKLPQKVADWNPSIYVKEPNGVVAIGYMQNKYLARQLYRDLHRLGVYAITLVSPDFFDEILEDNYRHITGRTQYLFIEDSLYDEEAKRILRNHPEIQGVVLVDFFSNMQPDLGNVRILKKPISSINIALALNNEEQHYNDVANQAYQIDYIAPEAEVMIVDDNAINLTVAEGLMEPIKMKITTATSGMECLEQLTKRHYDIIFMDHMMPEMDGIETTQIIRREHPECDNTAIIALTANAMDGTKELFLSEGMNDFVAKPIEMKTLVPIIKKWLPIEKIRKRSETLTVGGNTTKPTLRDTREIGDLNVSYATSLVGSEKLYEKILKDFYYNIKKKASLIAGYKQEKNWKSYTIEVHALKSAAKQVGAMKLSEMAEELEKAGNMNNVAYIREYTQEALEKYVSYLDVLAPLFPEQEEQPVAKKKLAYEEEKVQDLLAELRVALENLDMDTMEQTATVLGQYSLPSMQESLLMQLSVAIGNYDVDACAFLIDAMQQ